MASAGAQAAVTGAAAGAAAGTAILPGIGTAVGAVVGGLAGLFGGAKGSEHGGAIPGDLAVVQSQLDRGDPAGLFGRLAKLGDCSQGGKCTDHRGGLLELAHDYGYIVPGTCLAGSGGGKKARVAAGCVAPSTIPTLAPAATTVPASAPSSTAPVLDLNGPGGDVQASSAATIDPTLLLGLAAAAWYFLRG